MTLAIIPDEAVAGVVAVLVIVVVWLGREQIRLRERVSRLEGIVNHREGE